ncbi:MAG: hypothetical protein ABSC92_15180 [Rhizomicrobium sp.]
METPLQRITAWPLRADKRSVRGAATGYHVATISDGMNDREEYARLFAAAPNLLATLQSFVEEVSELRRQGTINEERDVVKIDALLARAQMYIAATGKSSE